MNVYDFADRHRGELLIREDRALAAMLEAWKQAERAIALELLRLLLDAPETRTIGWLFRTGRLKALEEFAAQEMARFGLAATPQIESLQTDARNMAVLHAPDLMAARAPATVARVGATFYRPSAEALEALVGTLADGSPLREIFDGYGPAASEMAREAVVQGLALGKNPRVTGRAMARAIEQTLPMPPGGPAELMEHLGGLRRRSEVIARTESLRSYRGAALESYAANPDVVQMWEWSSARDVRTCPVCWAMDGEVFDLDTPFGSHVQCRCSPLPVTVESDPRATGPEAFERLPEADQVEILGPKKYELYATGRIGLKDLVRYSDDPKWGPQRNEASAAEALRSASARER